MSTNIQNCRSAIAGYKWVSQATEGDHLPKIQALYQTLLSALRCLSTPNHLQDVVSHFQEKMRIAIEVNIISLEKEKAAQLAMIFPEHLETFSQIKQEFTSIETEIETRNLSQKELFEKRAQVERQIIALEHSALKASQIKSSEIFVNLHGTTLNLKYQAVRSHNRLPKLAFPVWLNLENPTESLFELPKVYSEQFPAPHHSYWRRKGFQRTITPLFDSSGKQAFVLAHYNSTPGIKPGEMEVFHCLSKSPSPHLVCEMIARNWTNELTMIAPYWETDLFFLLTSPDIKLSPTQLIFICKRVALAVADLHERDCFQGDIKPENGLCNKELTECALTDFGLSGRTWSDKTPYRKGTPAYSAPEVIGHNVLTKEQIQKADDYSLGATIFTIATGNLLSSPNAFYFYSLVNPKEDYPYARAQKAFDNFWTTANRPKDPVAKDKSVQEKLIQLSYLLTRINPDERLSAKQAVERIDEIEAEEMCK